MSSFHSAASLSTLHDVELQLMLHCLSAREILSFARCSRRLLVTAAAPFGWKCCPALPIRHLDSTPLDAAGLAARCAPLCVAWRYISEMAVIQTLAGRCRIYSLVISSGGDLIEAHAATMLAGLALQAGLEQLHLCLNSTISPGLMQAIADLPHLRFLSLSSACSFHKHSDSIALLASSRSLQHVRWTDSTPHARHGLADYIAQLPSLTAVTILAPDLYQHAFRRFFTAPNMSALRSITLSEFKLRGKLKTQRYHHHEYCVGPPVEDFAVVFTALTQLTRLALVECEGIGALLPALIRSPSLRQLIIQPDCDPRNKRWNSTFPKKHTLLWLLQVLPALCVALHLPSLGWFPLHVKNVTRQREAFASLSDALTSRYQLSASAVDGLDEPFSGSPRYWPLR